MADKKTLKAALDFAKLVGKKEVAGAVMETFQTHCRIADDYVVATNGTIHAGHPLPTEGMHWCPNTHKLGTAVNQIKGTYDIIHDDNGHVTIRSGPRTRMLQCVNKASIPHIVPDPKHVAVSDTINDHFKTIAPLIAGGDDLLCATVLLGPNHSLITDKMTFIECYHGLGLPGPVALTKNFLQVVNRVKHTITHLGLSMLHGQSSLTVWFENGAWLKTQLWGEQWPDLSAFMDGLDTAGCAPVPVEMVAAMDYIADDVQDNDVVYIHPSMLRTANDELSGSTVELATGAVHIETVSCKRMIAILKLADRIDLNQQNRIVFVGENVRGAVAKIAV